MQYRPKVQWGRQSPHSGQAGPSEPAGSPKGTLTQPERVIQVVGRGRSRIPGKRSLRLEASMVRLVFNQTKPKPGQSSVTLHMAL